MIEEMTDFQEGEVVVETDGEDVCSSRTNTRVMVKVSHAVGAYNFLIMMKFIASNFSETEYFLINLFSIFKL